MSAGPYRTLRAAAGPLPHWNPMTVTVSRAAAWRFGPFAGGCVEWRGEHWRVVSCWRFAFWFRTRGEGSNG